MSENGIIDSQRDIGSTKGTFEISVKFMQNSTWQGQIYWIEKNQKQNFRSALEMLKLMDEALNDDNEGDKTVNWQENEEPQPGKKRLKTGNHNPITKEAS